MDFRSDNVTGVHPEVMEALARANTGTASAYGDDDLTQRIERRIADLFETKADVFLVATGTAANALALAALAPPFGGVFCHPGSHIHKDECGAPEFYSGGAKLLPLPDRAGKIAPADIEPALGRFVHGVHNVQVAAVSITQAAETGVVYSLDEMSALATLAHGRGLKLHVDGARFANALVTLNCTPAQASWKSGADILCFGASKNGAMAAEAIVVFDHGLAATLAHRRKRGGHLFSKMRFLAAQFDAYLSGDLWLRNAAHANAMARRLATGLSQVPGAVLKFPVEANEVFVELPEPTIGALEAAGFQFYRWGKADSPTLRLVSAFDTDVRSVDKFLAIARGGSAAGR